MAVMERGCEPSPGEPGGPDEIAVVLVDDHAVVRAGLRLVLENEGVRVLAEAGDLSGARDSIAEHHPDVLVLDLHLGSVTALALLAEMPTLSPRTSVVVLTMQGEAGFVNKALGAGATG